MKKMTSEQQRAVNGGGLCFRVNQYLGSAVNHYHNNVYLHRDTYRYKSGSWFYYGN